jgi:hypothetical protein
LVKYAAVLSTCVIIAAIRIDLTTTGNHYIGARVVATAVGGANIGVIAIGYTFAAVGNYVVQTVSSGTNIFRACFGVIAIST